MNEEEKQTLWEKIKSKVTVVAVLWTVICAVAAVLLYLWYRFEDDEDYDLDDDFFDNDNLEPDDWWNDDYETAQKTKQESSVKTSAKNVPDMNAEIVSSSVSEENTSEAEDEQSVTDEHSEENSVFDDDWEEYDFFDFDDDEND